MPAIQPARLKQQSALLAEYFDTPPAFVRSLHHLLDSYADHVQRAGRSGEPPPLLASYKVRPPVLRQIWLELRPLAAEDPQAALALCDALWDQPYLEFRQLAASILAQVSPRPPDPVVERIQNWIKPDTEERLTILLLTQGFSRLRNENPEALLDLVEAWLTTPDVFMQQMGLRALQPFVGDLEFENLPVFFRLINPFARVAPPALRPDILNVLSALAHRSPQETAFFLRQNLHTPNSPDAPWFLRQTLQDFPPDIQESLRAAVRGVEWQPGKR